MANPFKTANQGMNPQMQNIREVYNIFKNSNNPLQVFQQMAMRNPQMQPIVQALRNGGNPQAIFNQMCQQRGIDPQQFIKSITG